jgi:hypothetical protein
MLLPKATESKCAKEEIARRDRLPHPLLDRHAKAYDSYGFKMHICRSFVLIYS